MGFFSKLAIVSALAVGPLAVGTACQAPVYPSTSGNDALANSVFLIDTGEGTGTAWVVKNEDGKSLLITAGHVCGAFQADFELIRRGPSEDRIPAHRVMSSDYPDLCELVADTVVGDPIPLATNPPKYDEELILIGAPNGLWGGGIAPIFHLRSIGQDKFSGPIYPGDSGAPVISKDGVVGVVSGGWFKAQVGEFVTVKVLRDWMDVKNVSTELGPAVQ